MKLTDYEKRVRELETQGCTRSDAQAVVDAEAQHPNCPACGGDGEEPGAPISEDGKALCSTCEGRGWIETPTAAPVLPPLTLAEAREIERERRQDKYNPPQFLLHVTDGGALYIQDKDRCSEAAFSLRIDNDNLPYTEAKALAAFIVRACNAHEELIEALKAVMDCNRQLGAISRPIGDQARAAIAKAKGQK